MIFMKRLKSNLFAIVSEVMSVTLFQRHKVSATADPPQYHLPHLPHSTPPLTTATRKMMSHMMKMKRQRKTDKTSKHLSHWVRCRRVRRNNGGKMGIKIYTFLLNSSPQFNMFLMLLVILGLRLL